MKEISRPHQFFIPGCSPVFTGKKRITGSKKIRETISGNYPRQKKSKKKIRNLRASSQPGSITRSRYRWPIPL
jgi:hypothetical protein